MAQAWGAALAAALSIGWFSGAAPAQERMSSEAIGRVLTQIKPGVTLRHEGDDSCVYANDFACDEPGIGSGACEAGTDYSDCWRIIEGREDDSCQWADDGECDEPNFGTGACTMGTDVTDCGDVSALRFQTDSCRLAFNGVCDVEDGASGACAPRTDRSDCVGRDRPARINDHFFGRDDRILADGSRLPWTTVGLFTSDGGGSCTATLVAENVVATAAHCIVGEGGVLHAAGRFRLADRSAEARVVDFLADPDFNNAEFSAGDELDGLDWALLRLDRALGAGGRYVVPAPAEPDAPVAQAGYSWDTDPHLSANESCRLLELYPDNTFSHACDTTRGDSGSPFLQRRGEDWVLIGTDSNFRSNDGGQFIYIAVQAAGWLGVLDAFAAGETGMGGVRQRAGGKPVAPPRKPQ